MWSYNQNHQNSFNWVIFRGYLHERYEKSPQIVSEKRPTLKFCPSQWLNADHYRDLSQNSFTTVSPPPPPPPAHSYKHITVSALSQSTDTVQRTYLVTYKSVCASYLAMLMLTMFSCVGGLLSSSHRTVSSIHISWRNRSGGRAALPCLRLGLLYFPCTSFFLGRAFRTLLWSPWCWPWSGTFWQRQGCLWFMQGLLFRLLWGFLRVLRGFPCLRWGFL